MFAGPIQMNFQRADDLTTGRFRVRSMRVCPGHARRRAKPSTDTAVRQAPAYLEINGVRHPLEPPGLVIGRGSNADLRIDDPGVSRRHVEFRVQAPAAAPDGLGEHRRPRLDQRHPRQRSPGPARDPRRRRRSVQIGGNHASERATVIGPPPSPASAGSRPRSRHGSLSSPRPSHPTRPQASADMRRQSPTTPRRATQPAAPERVRHVRAHPHADQDRLPRACSGCSCCRGVGHPLRHVRRAGRAPAAHPTASAGAASPSSGRARSAAATRPSSSSPKAPTRASPCRSATHRSCSAAAPTPPSASTTTTCRPGTPASSRTARTGTSKTSARPTAPTSAASASPRRWWSSIGVQVRIGKTIAELKK